jgi:membrane protein implicated in regulation of membrane protease activity
MDLSLAWAIAGLVLVIVELLTGTFYLLMLALAAFGAAAAGWLGYEFPAQAVVAALVAGAGCYAVHVYRGRDGDAKMAPIDAGMPASFETWIDSGSRLARVRYRGASWDAHVEGADTVEPGAMLYVLSADGNTLKVTKKRFA